MAISGKSAQQFDALWEAFGPDYGLLPDLALDAVIARYKQGELACVPRMVELTCTRSVSVAESAEALQLLDLAAMSSKQRHIVETTLDYWWLQTLSLPTGATVYDAGSNSPSQVLDTLGILAGLDAPMHRWLQVWLENFDGPGANFFVDAVLSHKDGNTTSEAWRAKPDKWSQFRAWCRAEPTVMGFTLIGGSHVEEGEVAAVLEQLI